MEACNDDILVEDFFGNLADIVDGSKETKEKG
jgi:glycosylphosphatidylinositol transamidase (GPIT) subunit GPI8